VGTSQGTSAKLFYVGKFIIIMRHKDPLPGLELALEFKSSGLGFGKCNPSHSPSF
jgi:hypothetical protein